MIYRVGLLLATYQLIPIRLIIGKVGLFDVTSERSTPSTTLVETVLWLSRFLTGPDATHGRLQRQVEYVQQNVTASAATS